MYQKAFRSQMRLVAASSTAALLVALSGSSASADTAKCLATISKSTAKYELAVQKALGKCQDANAKDPMATPSCPDAGASGKISKALTKLSGKITGDCGGETVDGLGFGGLVNLCNGGTRNGLFCAKNSDCDGICNAGGQIGDPCTSNANCAGACSLNGVELMESGGPVSCKGNGTPQCQAKRACLPGLTTECATDADCGGAPGSCVGKCSVTTSTTCVTSADCPVTESCVGRGSCTAFPGNCANAGTCDASDGCPNLINKNAPFSDCTGPLATIADLTTCLACNSTSMATAATAFAWDGRRPLFGNPGFGLPDHMDGGKSNLACQRGIGKAVGKYFQTVRKATQKCTASLQKMKVPSCPDPTLTGVISGAQTNLLAAINAACPSPAFAETVSEPNALKSLLNSEPLANALTPLPNGPGPFASIGESVLGTMMTCSDTFAGGLAAGLPACAPLTSNCGNGAVDAGEDCDDGNVVNGDTCPSNCLLPTACAVTGTVNVTFNVTSPVTPLGGLSAYLSYDNTKVNIPGTGNGAAGSVTAGAFSQSVNDLDSAIIVVLADPADIGSPPFSIQFNVCSGAAVSASDFDCLVQNAGGFDSMMGATNVFGVTCSVTVM
jgi:cysteine-rich repeat protein